MHDDSGSGLGQSEKDNKDKKKNKKDSMKLDDVYGSSQDLSSKFTIGTLKNQSSDSMRFPNSARPNYDASNSGNYRDATFLQKACFDQKLEACWLELNLNSLIVFPERQPGRSYVYLYTLRIWDGAKISDLAASGTLSQNLFSDESNSSLNSKTTSVLSGIPESLDEKFDGVEEFTWRESESFDSSMSTLGPSSGTPKG